MAKIIETTCPDCGKVALPPAAYLLTVFDAGAGHFYEFFCPSCYDLVRRPADERAQSVLMSSGARHIFEHVPAELLEEHWGPPLTPDDAMDLVLALRTRPKAIIEAASNGQDLGSAPRKKSRR